MHRCIELARQGSGSVAPNPMVGAVLLHNNNIIGEGYHEQYGQAHAEVNCINSVAKENEYQIAESVLYVSLEPCAHYGKTPPCADLIIEKKIPKVVIGCRDPFKEVDGKGIEKLKMAGIEVIYGILENDCKEINKRFFTFHLAHRPYIILKWAQTANGIMGGIGKRLFISNEYSNCEVHKWRSEEAAIMVGTNTALYDDPLLNNRLGKGGQPVRIVLDMNLRLPATLHLFDGSLKTIVFNTLKNETQNNLLFYQVNKSDSLLKQICNALYKLNIQSVLVEGGRQLLQSFIDASLFDEIRIITNNTMEAVSGISAPVIPALTRSASQELATDCIDYFRQPIVYQ